MWSWFKPKALPSTRLNNSERLKRLAFKLNELKLQTDNLAIAAKKQGGDSIDFEKHTAVESIWNKIDAAIRKFNSSPANKNKILEIEAELIFVKNITAAFVADIKEHQEIINKERDYNKTIYKSIIFAGEIATILSTGGLNFAAITVGMTASALLQTLIGVDKNNTTTYSLFINLLKILAALETNLEKYINLNKIPLLTKQAESDLTWGAIALCFEDTNNIFYQLPIELKFHVLSFLLSGYEAKQHREHFSRHCGSLFAGTCVMLANRQARIELQAPINNGVKRFEIIEEYTNSSPSP